MGQITVEKNAGGIPGLCVITPAVHGDDRGYFMETYSQRVIFARYGARTDGRLSGMEFHAPR